MRRLPPKSSRTLPPRRKSLSRPLDPKSPRPLEPNPCPCMTAPKPAFPGCAELQERLGYVFRDPALLRLALTHPSVAHEQNAPLQTNQRLEFLGDAVLQLL